MEKSFRKVAPARKVFVVFNYLLCSLAALTCLIPVVHVLALSFSGKDAIFAGRVTLWPVDFTLGSYEYVMQNAQFFTSYRFTLIRCVLSLMINLTLSLTAAYPMSLRKGQFMARKFFVGYFLLCMCFGGGLIPGYLMVKETGLINTIWALLIPNSVWIWSIILIMNFMKGLPDALSESAFIDGAGHLRTMVSIILPLSLPCLATMSLFILLGTWDSWFDGMLYVTRSDLKPLQTYMRSIVVEDTLITTDLNAIMKNLTKDGSSSAMIFLTLLPVLITYPFFQKYFAKGLVHGSVKE